MKRIAILLAGALLLGAGIAAQESAPREKVRVFTMDEPFNGMPPGAMMMQRMPEQIEFFSAELAAGGEVVTGAPYTATAITESTQTLADGNRIVDKTSSFIARDGQGRTRRELTLHRIGPLQMESPKTYIINDPTTHTQYVLSEGGEGNRIVRKEPGSGPMIIDMRRAAEEKGQREKIITTTRRGYAEKTEEPSNQVKHEDLGTQTIEGVSAQGRRETVTIPAGKIGNERPIEMVTEIWNSPELHAVVLRKHTDPRFGETVFRLTDIKRGEPDASLFQPPPGARIKSEKGDTVIELRREPGQPKE